VETFQSAAGITWERFGRANLHVRNRRDRKTRVRLQEQFRLRHCPLLRFDPGQLTDRVRTAAAFHELPPPSNADVAKLLSQVALKTYCEI
jgi:hypothetical protein